MAVEPLSILGAHRLDRNNVGALTFPQPDVAIDPGHAGWSRRPVLEEFPHSLGRGRSVAAGAILFRQRFGDGGIEQLWATFLPNNPFEG
jgi:hypothetical protein